MIQETLSGDGRAHFGREVSGGPMSDCCQVAIGQIMEFTMSSWQQVWTDSHCRWSKQSLSQRFGAPGRERASREREPGSPGTHRGAHSLSQDFWKRRT